MQYVRARCRPESTRSALPPDTLDTYELLKRKYQYNASCFLQMILEHSGVEAARRLIWKDDPSDGFTMLWELKRLDLSVEAYVIRAEYAPLFAEQRGIARARLGEYGYTV